MAAEELEGPAVLDVWLTQVHEEPLEPLLPIVDPHHHLWYARDSPEWRAGTAAQLSFGGARSGFGQYLVPQLLADMHGNNITHTVFLECHSFYDADASPELQSLRETTTVQQLADQHEARGRPGALNHRGEGGTAVCAGIVSNVDLALGAAVGTVLDAHAAASANFKGIRHSCSYADDANIFQASPGKPDVLDDPKFREGFACLAPRGLTFETWLFHLQLPALVRLARDFPDQTIICDHVAMPLGISSFASERGWDGSVATEWRAGIEALSKFPNVYVKLGGLTQPHAGFEFNLRAKPPGSEELADAVGPYYSFVIDHFGAERCMYESNFPPDRASCSYTVLWNAFKRISKARGCSDTEMTALFGGTAKRVYRLEGGKL